VGERGRLIRERDMSDTVIRVEGLGKRYRIGAARERYVALRDVVTRGTRAFGRRLLGRRPERSAYEDFWALKDVSFEVKRGECVGIIGRNGAGKSTLLKLLSRITEPTTGRFRVRGRVASLLEVGTGFHPELTGRENVFLNGAILGMKRAEIARKFDEIVAFAEVEKFLDTPVKYYSSGMYTRLAFAVAAHLEPEILIVDEVLAVGDAGFQKKCLGKMGEVAKDGRTVLFVSHQMSAITRLCERAVAFESGSLVVDAPAHETVHTYLSRGGETGDAVRRWQHRPSVDNDVVRVCAARVVGADGVVRVTHDSTADVWIELDYEVLCGGRVLVPNYHFYSDDGQCLFVVHDVDPAWRGRTKPTGRYLTRLRVPGNFLNEGRVVVNVAISSYDPFVVYVHERDALLFQVKDPPGGSPVRGEFTGSIPGAVRPLLETVTRQVRDAS
jgi:lipopolysaccharide transport system ATP-binding protein